MVEENNSIQVLRSDVRYDVGGNRGGVVREKKGCGR